ncbi:ABC transporter ATP-binding protein [Bacillus clarus]|uniref:ABC transporter ATP-binding protein n=1 Tax=Bacillus clarus TaxID=2338372 RepID=A0A090ZEG3_9BACI|nr:ABC transporter ATP-binding protein [Bacillus clarus]KFN02621.1 ABC transporter family protein [Bacillus clarus]RFT61735.1 ABC transporter ATP-binding protein [Bacillus clarus]
MLEIKNLKFQYEENIPLLQNISFSAKPGDIIWLQGSNGCGKSTLLRIIAQLIEVDYELYYNQKKMGSKEEILTDLIYIPSEPYLFDYLTGEENAEFLQTLFDISESDFHKFFLEMTEEFKVKHVLQKFVQEYSLGMRHKLYWSAVFARNAPIILLDEPFSSLDKSSQEIAIRMLKQKAAEGAIIIFVSHLPEISDKLATRGLTLEDGTIINRF